MAETGIGVPSVENAVESPPEEGGGADPVQLSTAFDPPEAVEASAVEGGAVSVDASAEGWDGESIEAPEANEAAEMHSSYVPLQLLEAEKVKNSFVEGEADVLRSDLDAVTKELEDEKTKHAATLKQLEEEKRNNADLREEFQRFKDIHGGGQSPRENLSEEGGRRPANNPPGSGGDVEQVKKELQEARKEISDLEAYSREVDNMTDDLQRQLKEKEKEIDALKRELEQNKQSGEISLDRQSLNNQSLNSLEGGREVEVPYDVLDRLDDELARAREQLLDKTAELEELQTRLDIVREQASHADTWKESAVQAQGENQKLREELERSERESEDERQIRRALEARFEEKLNLKTREAESLHTEVSRLKQAGDQLGPVLTELEHLKLENRHKLEHKNKEISRLQAALQVAEAGRQKGENQVRSMRGEMEEWEAKVKAAEEVRWRAGMNLAKAKAEMDWRQKADQEKDFFMERMKEELERLKNKQMRTEMRKLKVEESLEEAVMELRGKKREMEQMRARVDGLVRVLQVQGLPGGK